MNAEHNNTQTKYSVTAFLDLLGFSAHLEVAGNDLRTRIGEEAIHRLEGLENALYLMTEEQEASPSYYPQSYRYIRINDAVVFTMDLPDLLRPSIGELVKRGMSADELAKFFDLDKFEGDQEFLAAYESRLSNEVTGLVRFVGAIARFHSFVNRKESAAYHPGARTVIATGYRRPLPVRGTGRTEDFLSANFSFSNAYLAEKQLHGAGFFVDDNVSQMLHLNRFAKNLLRFACSVTKPVRFDPFEEREDKMYLGNERLLTIPIDVVLFRKSFQFRELDPYLLSYMQVTPQLSDYLEGGKQPAQAKKQLAVIAQRILQAIIDGPRVGTKKGSAGFPGIWRMDLEDNIRFFPELIEHGESPTMESKRDEESQRRMFGP